MNPTNFIGKVKSARMLNFRDIEVEFEHVNPSKMDFIPGQFISLQVGEKAFRTYSIASNPQNTNSVILIISVSHEGIGSNYLKQLKVGDEVKYLGPSGVFKLKKPYKNNLYFFATGTGLAPFISIFYNLLFDHFDGNIKLYFGIRSEDEMFYVDKLEYFKQNFKSFSYNILYSQPKILGNTPKYLSTDLINNFDNSQFYLCGHPQMVSDISNDLKLKKGVNEEDILLEKYTVAIHPK